MIKLFQFALRHSRAALLLVLAAGTWAALGISLTIVIGKVVSAVPGTGDGPSSTFVWLSGLLVAIFALESAQPVLLDLATRRTVYSLEGAGHRRILDPLLNEIGIGHLENREVQDRVARAQGIGSFGVRTGIESLGPLLAARLTAFGAAIVVGAYFSWSVAAVALTTNWLVEWYSARQLRAESDQLDDLSEEQRRSAYLFDLCMDRGAKEIRIFGLAQWFVERHTTVWKSAMAPLWKERRRSAMQTLAAYGLHLIVTVGIVVIAARAAASGDMGAAAATTVLMALLRLGMSADGHSASRLQRGLEALKAMNSLAPLVSEVSPVRERDPIEHAKSDGVDPLVQFDGVWFRYPGADSADEYVLKGLDLTIERNEALALVGINGAGKSTLVKLMAGLYRPVKGRVLIDGIDLAGMDSEKVRDWQRSIAPIPQDFAKFPLTLAENIAFGHADASTTDDEVFREAIDRSEASALVDKLPHGHDTLLAKAFEDGVDLSGGEWQRVALARALYGIGLGADLLVLDEPASALDVRAEAAMVDRYLELTAGVTSLIISHRFSVVRRAERICVLEDGRIVEDGPHEELLAEDRRYAAMFHRQAERFTGEDSHA